MKSVSDEILEAIKYGIERKTIACDKTYKSVIKAIVSKGYVILDNTGSERTVKCCIPNLDLRVGQSVWVKVPQNDVKSTHICGVV